MILFKQLIFTPIHLFKQVRSHVQHLTFDPISKSSRTFEPDKLRIFFPSNCDNLTKILMFCVAFSTVSILFIFIHF